MTENGPSDTYHLFVNFSAEIEWANHGHTLLGNVKLKYTVHRYTVFIGIQIPCLNTDDMASLPLFARCLFPPYVSP